MTKKTMPYSNLRLLSILGLICVLLASFVLVSGCGDDEEKATYTLTIAVSPAGGGTTSPSAGTYTYDEGEAVSITATAATGYEFDKWTGAASGTSATTSVTMTSNKTVTANFVEETPAVTEYTLTMAVDPADSGTTSPAVGTHDYDDGTVVDITATAADGYLFDGWTGDVADDASASTTVTMDADQTVTANFSLITYTLTMTAVTNVTTIPAAGDHIYTAGEVVDISAVPAAGWTASWTGDVAADATTVTMDADKTVTPVLTAATAWVYEVTHGTETTVWTYTVIDDSEMVDSVDCYVVDVSYSAPPARVASGMSVTIIGATNWMSKATFDTMVSVAAIDMGAEMVTTMTNTYADGHGWDYAVNTAYQYQQFGELDPPLQAPFGSKYAVAVVGLTNVSGYECYEITYTLIQAYDSDSETWVPLDTPVLEKTEWWSAEVGGLVKSINHTGYAQVETMLLTQYIPNGIYVPTPL